MYVKTKISKGYQIVVPAEIRKNLNLKAGDSVTWRSTVNGIIIEPSKEVTFEDICGIIDDEDELNSVQIKKRIQMGEKY